MPKNKYQKRKKTLIAYFRKYRVIPSYQDLVHLFGLKSKGSLHRYIERFIEDGFLEKSEHGQLVPTTKLYGLRVLGTVQAGFPTDAEEELNDTISLDHFLIDRPEATYMLRVEGDSMQDAGIVPGDLVLVDRIRDPLDHDIVVADVDGEWTLKYLIKNSDTTFLRAANKLYPDIYPKSELQIAGVVTSVVRKY